MTIKQNIKRIEDPHQNAEGDLNAKGSKRLCLVYKTAVTFCIQRRC